MVARRGSFARQYFDLDGIAIARNPGEIVGDGNSANPYDLVAAKHDRPERTLLGRNVLLGEQSLEFLLRG